jgi:DNA-binding NtrC family response regulator
VTHVFAQKGENDMTDTSILLVDDETAFVDAMTRRLKKRNAAVSQAYDGAQAMKCLEADPGIEVVILDVKMPGKDGIEVLKDIKQRHPLVEVIMLTGHGTVESAIDGMKWGANDYLMKPCDMDVLMAKAREAAAKKRQHEEKIIAARIKEITHRRA